MPQPGEEVKLDPQTRQQLGHELCDLIMDLEQDHQTYFEDLGEWWDWYHAKPLTKIRMDPWPRASNVVVPLISTASDQIVARLHNRLHTPRTTWTITTENEEIRDMIKKGQQFINRESRNTFDIQHPTKDWVQECVVIGESVIAVTWRERQSFRFIPGNKKPQVVIMSRGPVVEHVPREFMLWRKDRTIQESDVVVRRNNMLWSEIARSMQTDDWDDEQAESMMMSGGGHGPDQDVLERKRESFGVHTGNFEPHDVREVWVEWPLAQLMTQRQGIKPLELAGADDPAVPLVVTIHKETRQVLRVVAHPYFHGRWPFYDIYFRKMAGQGVSHGIAKMLEHIQRAVSTMTNQSIDSVTLGNSLKLATSSPTVRDKRFQPFHPFYVENLDDIKELNLQKQVFPDIAIIQMLNAVGERKTGIADPMLGREVSMGGHPSPATNTLVQLQEASKLFDMTLREIRLQLSAVGEFIFSLYQQFESDEDDGRLAAALGAEDAAVVREILVSPENFIFDIHSLSETVNPEAERNNAVLVDQLTTNYYAFALRVIPLMEQNPESITAQAAQKALEAKAKSLIQALEAMNVDDPEEFIFRLQESSNAQIGGVEQLAQQFGQGAPGQLEGSVQQSQVGGVQRGANGAAGGLAP